MRIKNTIYLFLGNILLLTSCVDEDYFGLSDYANIKKISLSNQSGIANINELNAMVTVEIPGGVDLSSIVVQNLELSSFATSSIKIGDTINILNPFEFVLTSESGTKRTWTIQAYVASKTPQLDNGDLNLWYETTTGYYEPGENADQTIWATGNRGTQLLNKLATVPIDLGNGNIAAKMETLSNGPLGAIFGAPISTGSLFTGIFNADKIEPSNPAAATEFGTPFAGRPIAVQLKYSYLPGEINTDKSGDALSYGDAADIYALLEVRLNGVTERLATAWLRTEKEQKEMVTIEIPFFYGQLDEKEPSYKQPENGLFVPDNQADFILPTHFTFVASSSFAGAEFAGAVGSTLIIDDVRLIYE